MKISKYVLHAAALIASISLPASASSITTTFAGGNRFTGNMFNASIGSSAIDVTSLDVNVDSGAMTIDVYVKTGTYAGFQTTPAAWTLVSATAVTGLGVGKSTAVNVTPFVLSASTTYGIYVTVNSNVDAAPYMYYTNGSNTYSNSNLTLTTGDGLGGLFGSIVDNSSRTWDGTINYSLASATPEPSSGVLLTLALPALFLVRRRYLRKY